MSARPLGLALLVHVWENLSEEPACQQAVLFSAIFSRLGAQRDWAGLLVAGTEAHSRELLEDIVRHVVCGSTPDEACEPVT
jgi:hypothetical protein